MLKINDCAIPNYDVVQAMLVELGWTSDDGKTATLASREYKTVNVSNTAYAYLSPGDGYNQTLMFWYQSEGRNQLESSAALIPLDATAEQLRNIVVATINRAHDRVNQTYGVRMAATSH